MICYLYMGNICWPAFTETHDVVTKIRLDATFEVNLLHSDSEEFKKLEVEICTSVSINFPGSYRFFNENSNNNENKPAVNSQHLCLCWMLNTSIEYIKLRKSKSKSQSSRHYVKLFQESPHISVNCYIS